MRHRPKPLTSSISEYLRRPKVTETGMRKSKWDETFEDQWDAVKLRRL
jgi:hypothetical protein